MSVEPGVAHSFRNAGDGVARFRAFAQRAALALGAAAGGLAGFEPTYEAARGLEPALSPAV